MAIDMGKIEKQVVKNGKTVMIIETRYCGFCQKNICACPQRLSPTEWVDEMEDGTKITRLPNGKFRKL